MHIPSLLRNFIVKNVWILLVFVVLFVVLNQLSEFPGFIRLIRRLAPALSSGFIEILLGLGSLLMFAAAVGGTVLWLQEYARRQANKRRRELQQVARELKWSYADKPGAGLSAYVDVFANYRAVAASNFQSKGASNVLSVGYGDVSLAIFDYSFTARANDDGTQHYETVYLLVSDKLDLPYFQTRPESPLGNNFVNNFVKNLAGFNDINFPQRADFSAKYILDGRDEPGLRRLFTRSVFDFYERNDFYGTIGAGKLLCLYRPRVGAAVDRAEINRNLRLLHEFYKLLKIR